MADTDTQHLLDIIAARLPLPDPLDRPGKTIVFVRHRKALGDIGYPDVAKTQVVVCLSGLEGMDNVKLGRVPVQDAARAAIIHVGHYRWLVTAPDQAAIAAALAAPPIVGSRQVLVVVPDKTIEPVLAKAIADLQLHDDPVHVSIVGPTRSDFPVKSTRTLQWHVELQSWTG